MQVLLAGFMIAISTALLWLSFVTVTRDYRYEWRGMVIWVIIATLVKFPLTWFGRQSNDPLYETLGPIAGVLMAYVFLYLVLSFRYHVESIGRKFSILALHFVGVKLFDIFIGLLMGRD